MKGFNYRIIARLWIIAAIIFYLQGILGEHIGEDYIKPFLKGIYCTGFAIYCRLDDKE